MSIERLGLSLRDPNVYGSRSGGSRSERRAAGLDKEASSLNPHAHCTSPVLRGKRVSKPSRRAAALPPANVPLLEENKQVSADPVRERLRHEQPVCASCHAHEWIRSVSCTRENCDAIGNGATSRAGAHRSDGCAHGRNQVSRSGRASHLARLAPDDSSGRHQKLDLLRSAAGWNIGDQPTIRGLMKTTKAPQISLVGD